MKDFERARKNGLKGAATVESVLRELGWAPEETDEEAVFRIDLSTEKIRVSEAFAKVRVDLERFLFLINFRDRASSRHALQTMEFITRANTGLVVGNFEMNMETGTISFKASVDFTHVVLSARLVRNAIVSAMDVVEYYADALVEVLHGRKEPIDAINAAEAAIAEAQSGDGKGK